MTLILKWKHKIRCSRVRVYISKYDIHDKVWRVTIRLVTRKTWIESNTQWFVLKSYFISQSTILWQAYWALSLDVSLELQFLNPTMENLESLCWWVLLILAFSLSVISNIMGLRWSDPHQLQQGASHRHQSWELKLKLKKKILSSSI